jgi:hypothetical protein
VAQSNKLACESEPQPLFRQLNGLQCSLGHAAFARKVSWAAIASSLAVASVQLGISCRKFFCDMLTIA